MPAASALDSWPDAPAFLRDPFPTLRRLREADPVHWGPRLKSWVLTRYDDCKAVCLHKAMSSDRLRPFFAALPGEERARIGQIVRYLTHWMVFRDPPDHTRLRRLTSKVFHLQSMNAMRPAAEELTQWLFDRIGGRKEIDFVADFAGPLPALVIMAMLGVPREELAKVNTIMKNITTATAMTGNGQAAPAGLSTARNSTLLQATLPLDAPLFSEPVLFNNIFWDNRAGTFTGATVAGIGLLDDPNPIFNWDLGVAGMAELLSPIYSLLQTSYGASPDANSLVGFDPSVVLPYETSVQVAPWRGNPRFVDVLMVTVLATPNFLGDYHLTGASPAIDAGPVAGAPGSSC